MVKNAENARLAEAFGVRWRQCMAFRDTLSYCTASGVLVAFMAREHPLHVALEEADMRHRIVQREFEISPRIVLSGLRAAGVEDDMPTLCGLLRRADVTLDEVAREIDFGEVYAAAYGEDDLLCAEQAAAGEIGRQIRDWLEERLAPVMEVAARMHAPC